MIRKGTIIFGIKLTGTFLLLCSNVLMNRLVGFEEFGKYVFVMGFVNVVVVVVCFGGDTYLKRSIGSILADGRVALGGSIPTIVAMCRQTTVLWALSLGAIWIFLMFSHAQLAALTIVPFCMVALLILGLSLAKLMTGILIGLSNALEDAAISSFLKPLMSVLVVMALIAIFGRSTEFNYVVLLGIQVAIIFLIIITAVFLLFAKYGAGTKKYPPAYLPRKLDGFTLYIKTCMPLAIVSSAVILERNVDILMLGYIDGSDASALYFICTRISALFLMPLFVLNSIVTPIIAKNFKANNYEVVQKKARQISLISSGVAVIILVITALFGKNILVIFGQEYVSAYTPMMLLSIGNMIRTMIGPSQMVAIMCDMDKEVSKLNVSSLVLNIILNAILIPIFGILGAVFATVFARLWRSSLLAVKIYRSHNIRVGIFHV